MKDNILGSFKGIRKLVNLYMATIGLALLAAIVNYLKNPATSENKPITVFNLRKENVDFVYSVINTTTVYEQ